jgi:hypothetical protein
MYDKRIENRPAFGFEDARDRFAVGRVGTESVYGFRRKCDERTRSDHLSGFGNPFLVGGYDPAQHLVCHLVCLYFRSA